MKINKRDLNHWVWLALFSVNVLLAVLLRKLVPSSNKLVLYGHKLNGNLAAIYRESLSYSELNLVYLTMDYGYYRKLKKEGIAVAWAGSLQALILLVKAKVLISDHGLHSLVLLLDYSSLKFIDVWHGIPFKGFDKDDFKVQRRYDEVWVASEFLADLYEHKFGFDRGRLKAIGYARTDVLVSPGEFSRAELMRAYDITVAEKKVVLYAPTWKQDDNSRGLHPFGLTEVEFLSELSGIAESNNCIFLIRAHLNSESSSVTQFDNVFAVPVDTYPDSERLLLISDILIYDWSSIAFDFLLLNKPAIYLDVPAPFKKGFSLDGSYRYGEAVTDLVEFKLAIAKSAEMSETGLPCIDCRRRKIKTLVYERYADGLSSARSCQEISRIV